MPNNELQNEFSERHQILISFECELRKKKIGKEKRKLTGGNSFSPALNKGNKCSGIQ